MATSPPRRREPAAARYLDRPRVRRGTSETEIAIYEATEKLLDEVPFADLSVAQIIDRAGLSRASFYHYFSSKLGVIAGLLVSVMDEIFEVATPFMRRPGVGVTESLRVSMQTAMHLWTAHRLLLRVVMENWASSEELEAQWCGVMARFADAVASEIDQERAEGHLPSGLPSAELASALVWSTERCLYVAGRGLLASPVDEHAEVAVLVALWVGALQIGAAQEA